MAVVAALLMALAIVASAGTHIGIVLPLWLGMPAMLAAPAALLAVVPTVRSVCDSILESHARVVASVIGTVTAAALLGLAFLAGRTAEAYAPLREAGELGELWGPLSAFLWTGCVGAIGFVGVMAYLVCAHAPVSSSLLSSAQGLFSVVAVAAAAMLAVLLWVDIYQLVEWVDVEVWLPGTSATTVSE